MLFIDNLRYQFPGGCFTYTCCAKPGEVLHVMGKSGAGKTTLFNLLCGFLKPDSGRILFDHHDLLPDPPRQRPISYLMQDHPLFDSYSAFENIAFGLCPSLKLTPQDHKDLLYMAQLYEVEPFLKQPVKTLSGGQRQRIAIIQTLLQKRPILLLDEPFKGLDTVLIEKIIVLIKKHIASQGIIGLMASHERSIMTSLTSSHYFI